MILDVDLENHTATIYEGGGYFIKGRNFKRVIKTDKTTKGLAGWKGWGAVRVIELNWKLNGWNYNKKVL